MNNEATDNNIDDIFRKGIEPLETAPSEEFWRKAAEGVILRNNQLNREKNSRWRFIAFILCAALLGLGYFSYEMQNELKRTEQQVKAVKKNLIAMQLNNQEAKSKLNNNPSAPQHSPVIVKALSTGRNPSAAITANATFSAGSNFSGKYNNPAKKSAELEKKIETNELNNSTGGTGGELAENMEPYPVQNYNFKNMPKTGLNEIEINYPTAISLNETPDTLLQLRSTNIDEMTYAINANRLSKFSISLFLSPDYSLGYKFKSDNSWANYYENIIKDEKQAFSFTAGAMANYQLSSHFSISAGIAYSAFSFNSNPGIIYAQKQSNGSVGYDFTTSSGVVECPSYDGYNKVGDSLKMNATSTRTFLEIPAQLKYFLSSNDKLKFYLVGGIETNITLMEKTTMNWQDFWYEQGTTIANSTEGSSTLYFSYYLAMGADYKVSKLLSLYAEPGLNNAITAIDNNTPVVSYPRLFSLKVGLTYYLK